MLVKKQYIVNPIGLWESLSDLLKDSFFADGNRPTSDFGGAFETAVNGNKVKGEVGERRALQSTILRTRQDIHGMLNMSLNRFYKTKSVLGLFREAEWIPDRIPEHEISPLSVLGMIRIARTKYVDDPVTGRRILEVCLVSFYFRHFPNG